MLLMQTVQRISNTKLKSRAYNLAHVNEREPLSLCYDTRPLLTLVHVGMLL